ncbi:hypothetical protein NW759_015913 [Fusarium solani]|nr:hypothetical protein NW759_015913 [Fusarium solani]
MAEPGTPASDLAALFATTRRVSSQIKQVQESLKSIAASIQQDTSEPRSSTPPATRSTAGGKGSSESAVWTKAIPDLKEACEKMDSLETTAETLIIVVSQLLQESRARADGSPVHDALDQEGGGPGREEGQQDETPARTAEAGCDPPGRRSNDDALHGLTRFAGHARRKQPVVDSSLPHLRSGSHPASPQINAATSPEAVSNAAQQQQVHPADGHEGSPRSPPPRDSGTATQNGNAAAQGASTHQHRKAEPEDQALANAHGDNSVTSIKASRDTSSDGSNEDTPMREHEPENGDADTVMTDGDQPRLLDENDSIQPVPNPGKPNSAADSRPSVGAHPADEPRSPRSASRQVTVNNQGDTSATNHTPEAEASGPEDEDVVMGGSGAAQGEGNAGSTAANDRSARPSAPEDDTGGDRSEANPQTQPTTANPTGQGAGAQVNMQSPFNGATPKERTMQLPTTPNSQGSDTTEDTSRATTPNTHLTSPGTSVPDSPPQLTLSKADMRERLVEALGRIIKRDDSMHKISAPNLPIDLDLIKAAVKAGLSAPKPDWQFTANRFVPGPKGEGYMRAYISKRRSHFAFPDFPDKVVIPAKEEARKWLDDYFDNPPEGIVPYFTGHLDLPYGDLLNPGAMILDNPKLLDLHRPYWHIGGDKSANRFHIEDYNCSEDESPCGLRSANLVLEGVKLWTAIETHHTKKFEAFVAKNWDCNGCSQRVGHQSLLISPLTLEREGIDFEIKVQGPGDLMIPGRSQYHMVVNMTFNIAMSMNHLQRGDRLKSMALRQCVKCGVLDDTVTRVPPPNLIRTPLPSTPDPPPEQSEAQTPLVSEAPKSPKRLATKPSAAPASKRMKGTKRSEMADPVLRQSKRVNIRQDNDRESVDTPRVRLESLQKLVDKFRAENLLCKVPTLRADQLPTERVLRLACAMSSRIAIQQFHSMVQSWNGWPRLREDVPLPGEDPISRIQHRVLLVDKYASMDILCNYLLRQSQFSLVKEVEAHRQGQMRTDPTFIKQVCERARWTRRNYDYHYRRGKQWIAIWDRNEGILPFLHHYTEPFNISPTRCLDLGEDELSSLASLLDNHVSKALLKAGVAFQQAVEESRSVRLAWDGHKVDWDGLDENKLMLYLEVVDD